jgi:hypothetical protein
MVFSHHGLIVHWLEIGTCCHCGFEARTGSLISEERLVEAVDGTSHTEQAFEEALEEEAVDLKAATF